MKKLIMDIDTGIDDALAIAYAVRSDQFDMLGFTTTFGNVPLEVATRNTKKVAEKLGVQIPVYPGSAHPLRKQKYDLTVAKQIHGEDGLGNTLDSNKANDVVADQAIPFIIEKLHEYPDEITLLFVGPLTNLAKAVEQDRAAVEKAANIVIMGGAVTVPGNVRPHAEANIFSDPDAAKVVLESDLPVTLVGLDVTMQTLLPMEEIKKWYDTDDKTSTFFADIASYYVRAYEEFKPGLGGCGLHDPLAVGVILDPSFVHTEKMALTVDVAGDFIGATRRVEKGNATVDVCLQVDKERFLSHFLQTLNF